MIHKEFMGTKKHATLIVNDMGDIEGDANFDNANCGWRE